MRKDARPLVAFVRAFTWHPKSTSSPPNMFSCRQHHRPGTKHRLRGPLRSPPTPTAAFVVRVASTGDRPALARSPYVPVEAVSSLRLLRTASKARRLGAPGYEGPAMRLQHTRAGTDWATVGRPRCPAPVTRLLSTLVATSTIRYEYHQRRHRQNRTTPLDGTYYLTADGTPEMSNRHQAAGA